VRDPLLVRARQLSIFAVIDGKHNEIFAGTRCTRGLTRDGIMIETSTKQVMRNRVPPGFSPFDAACLFTFTDKHRRCQNSL